MSTHWKLTVTLLASMLVGLSAGCMTGEGEGKEKDKKETIETTRQEAIIQMKCYDYENSYGDGCSLCFWYTETTAGKKLLDFEEFCD